MTERPAVVNESLRRAALARARTTTLASARHQQEQRAVAAERREALLKCIRLGITETELAANLGVTTRMIRKILRREEL